MAKKCAICGTPIAPNGLYCPKCGSAALLKDDDYQDTTILDDNPYPYNHSSVGAVPPNFSGGMPQQPWQPQPPTGGAVPPNFSGRMPQQSWQPQPPNFSGGMQQQPWQPQPPVPPVPRKKTNVGAIIGIVLGAIVLLVVIGIFAGSLLLNKEPSGDYGVNGEVTAEESDYAYTTGTFDGTEYVNLWADIRLPLPAGFSNADAETYNGLESDTVDAGVYYVSDTETRFIYICYEEIPSFYDEEDYLDSAMKQLVDMNTDLIITPAEAYYPVEINGKTYLSADFSMDNGFSQYVQSTYVRKLDGRIIGICILGETTEKNEELLHQIQPALPEE